MADGYLEEIESDEMESSMHEGAAISQDGDDIVVDLEGRTDRDTSDSSDHDANLAELLDEDERLKIGLELIDMVKEDEESRDKWKRRLVSGLEIIGVEEIPTESSAFDGSSTVTHPAIAEAMVRFQANAMEELFPAEGPVKTKVIGVGSPELEDQALRVQDFMNYQLTEEDDEYFDSTDMMTMYLPYSGSAFKKVYYDEVTGMTTSRFVTAEDLIVPYDATSLKTASRYTHKYKLTGNEINAKIDVGEFLASEALDPSGLGIEQTSGENSSQIPDISDDREPFRAEDDLVYEIYEVHAEMIFEEFDEPNGSDDNQVALPYVLTIEKDSGEILAIRRLWREDDEKRRKRIHFIHYKFLPGLGFYGWGYLHIIGSLGKAASGALRALLDGSATASLQGGFKSKESKVSGEFVFTPGVWKDVDMTAEDLAKSFYTPPFKEPSPALFHTLELLVGGIQNFSSTTEAMTGAADNKGPVGTTLALIEQGSKVYSGIHKRMHKAARFEFKLIAQLNYEHMDDEYPFEVIGGDRTVFKDDFDGRVDIIPVSDPNIYSNVQRVAQAQAILELVQSDPELYGEDSRREAHMEMFKALRVGSPERFLPDTSPKRLDPVTENQMILTGQAVSAFPEQDHQSHIQAHQVFMQEAAGMGLGDEILQAGMLNMNAHIAEHHAHAYRLRIEQQLGIELPDTDFQEGEDEDLPINIDNAVARAVAANVAPPPPAQGPEPSEEEQKQAAHELALQHADEAHQQKMKHKEDEHGLQMAVKDEAAELDMSLKSRSVSQDLETKVKKDEQDIAKKQTDNMLSAAERAANLKEG
jgi:uncharacterized tellurite resistance protein B-like protein